MQQLDPRIVRIGIEIDGRIKYFEGLDIHAQGTKYANSIQNEAEVKISNLNKETRDYILTETSPFNLNRKPKKLIIEAGRESYGTTQIFVGNITSSSIGQPPDIPITLKSLTKNHKKGNVISRSRGAVSRLSTISQGVADDLETNLIFEADDKNISNYSFSGGALKQMDALQDAGGVDVFIDNETLIVKNRGTPLKGQKRVLNIDTGLIGIPELTEHGLRATCLIDNKTAIGGALEIQSLLNPSLNGLYSIYQMGFNIASRDTPFYYLCDCKRVKQ